MQTKLTMMERLQKVWVWICIKTVGHYRSKDGWVVGEIKGAGQKLTEQERKIFMLASNHNGKLLAQMIQNPDIKPQFTVDEDLSRGMKKVFDV